MVDVGSPCINRDNAGGANQRIDGSNPAPAGGGAIGEMHVYANESFTVIAFSGGEEISANRFTSSGYDDSLSLSASADTCNIFYAGTDYTEFSVNEGDYIGIEKSTGGYYELTTASGDGYWTDSSEPIPWNDDSFGLTSTGMLSLKGVIDDTPPPEGAMIPASGPARDMGGVGWGVGWGIMGWVLPLPVAAMIDRILSRREIFNPLNWFGKK